MTKANMMREAHKLAKTFEGDYTACLALALRTIHKISVVATEEKENYYNAERKTRRGVYYCQKNNISLDSKIDVKNVKLWAKGNKSRLYFDVYFDESLMANDYIVA